MPKPPSTRKTKKSKTVKRKRTKPKSSSTVDPKRLSRLADRLDAIRVQLQDGLNELNRVSAELTSLVCTDDDIPF